MKCPTSKETQNKYHSDTQWHANEEQISVRLLLRQPFIHILLALLFSQGAPCRKCSCFTKASRCTLSILFVITLTAIPVTYSCSLQPYMLL